MPRTATQKCAVVVSYIIFFALAWNFSVNLEVVPGKVSWFMPAGLRMVALLFLSRRHWWLIWFGEVLAILLFTRIDYAGDALWSIAVGTVLPFPCYALAILAVEALRSSREVAFRASPLQVNTASVVGTVVDGLVHVLNWLWSGTISEAEFPEVLLSFVLGNMVGVSLVLPMLWLVQMQRTQPVLPWLILVLSMMAASLAMVVDLSAVGYYVKIAMLIVLHAAVARAGLRGAILCTLPMSLFIMASHWFQHPLGPMDQDQFFLIFITLGALTIGDAVSRAKQLTKDLSERNSALRSHLQALEQLNKAHQDLAARMVNVEEAERRRFSRELHDGLGQLLSGARMQLQAVVARAGATDRSAALGRIDEILRAAYDTARQLMNELTPTPILQVGLENALSSSAISGPLKARGINYHLHYVLPDVHIPEAAALQLFRIVQEAANNAAKHAEASELRVCLQLAGNRLQLSVADDGQGFSLQDTHRGLGLDNIKDRAALLGADYELQSGPGGTCHRCTLTLDSLATDSLPTSSLPTV